jgi:4-amino-4-deoxy-L-arabinose transferase-like glycosyltransferase
MIYITPLLHTFVNWFFLKKSMMMHSSLQSLFKIPSAVAFVLCYFFFQTLFISYTAHGASADEAELLANSSYFQWGCIGGQPPLYSWLTLLSTKILGTNLLALETVRFTLLASLFLSVYGSMRLLGFSYLAAAASMFGLFLIQEISFNTQRSTTHSVAVIAGCGWVLFLFAWHMKSPSWQSAALLGFAMALALLGKLNAIFFIAGLLLAGISLDDYRRLLLSKYSFLMILICICCLAPTAWTTLAQGDLFCRMHKFNVGANGNVLIDRIMGSFNLFKALAKQAIFPIVIVGYLLWRNRPSSNQFFVARNEHQFILRLYLFQFVCILISIIASGVTTVKVPWLLPLLFMIPTVLVCILIRYSGENSLRDFKLISMNLSLILIPTIATSLHYHGLMSDRFPSRDLDYNKLFHFLKSEGNFHTIVTDAPERLGNFRLIDPRINIVHLETPRAISPIRKPLLVIWLKSNLSLEKLRAILKQANIDLPSEEIKEVDLFYQSKKAIPYYYAIIP